MRTIAPTSRSRVRSELADTGYAVVANIEPDHLPDVLGQCGIIAPFMGEWKYDVEVRDELAGMYTARSFEALYPHLDKYEWPAPPDLVALYGRQADRCGQGTTHVCDMTPFLDALSPEDTARLRTRAISYQADEGLQAVGIDHRHHGPALDLTDPDWPRFRFSYNYSVWPADDPGFADLWNRTKDWYEVNKRSVLLTENTLLIWRNTLVLHSRDRFTDPDRCLWRVYLNRLPVSDA